MPDVASMEVAPHAAARQRQRTWCERERERKRNHTKSVARTLDAASLRRSLLHMGDGWGSVVRRLRAGRPMSLGVIGASVAQNAGCLTQPGQRCMQYSGAGGGRSGFAVRFLTEVVNASFPHAGHSLHNAASDATPAQVLQQCLRTRLPSTGLDVVLRPWRLFLNMT